MQVSRMALVVSAMLASFQLLGQTQGKERPVEHPTFYRTIQIDGLSIFYRETGPKDAPTILLLHGLPSSSRMFEPLLTRLAGQFHMVAPDYPGFGHSDAPTSKEFSYTFDNIATVMDHFTEALNLTRYTLYMQDYGGPVGFRMTLAHPDRVEALIVSKCRRPQRRPRNELEDQACVLGGPRLTRGHAADQLALAGRHADAARGERPEPREVRSRSVDRRIRVPEQARRGRHPERSLLRLPQQRGRLPDVAGMDAKDSAARAGALGSQPRGIDLSKPLEDGIFAWIQGVFAEHPVLVFRDQDLSAAELAAFGRRYGTPRRHALIKYRHADCPEVSWLTNVDETGKTDWYGVKRATDWHTDSTYEDTLPLLAMLHAKEVPSEKGGTMFADMRAAYEALPEVRKQLLSGLTGLHGRSTGPAGERLYGDDKGVTEKKYQEVQWPAVTRHPVTRRPILFVNPMHTHGFVGMKREEAWPLIDELAAHATQERFVYYHRWRVGDVLIWDERATMHRGAGDYRPDERRIMLRTIVYPN